MPLSAMDSELRLKVSRVANRQKELKIAFNTLKSQIGTGLLEAEDVFASLAIPLMKLVGLKTVEMSKEGRFSSIIVNQSSNSGSHPNFDDWPRSRGSTEEGSDSSVLTNFRADSHQRTGEYENFSAKATQACNELMHKQKLQLMQLVQILQKIEFQVNASKDDILDTIADHRASLQNLFQKAVTYVYKSHQSNGMSPHTLKLLKFTFEHFGSALGSVEIGVENLISDLADKMCHPMVKYVKCLKADLVAGTCQSLLGMLEDMEGTIRLKSLELDEARRKVKAVENSRLSALSKLKVLEDKLSEMKEHQRFTFEAQMRSRGCHVPEKLSHEEVNPAKDEALLWELLRKKRKLQASGSPFGPKMLRGTGSNSRHLMSPSSMPAPSSKNLSLGLSPRMSNTKTDFWVPLNSFSSTTTRSPQLMCLLPSKRIRT